MSARYILRLDDACPRMPKATWDRIEAALDRHEARPLVAVVPDNRDPGLDVDPPDPRFWDRVRRWQAKGWSIGLHGLTHVYASRGSGLVGLNRRSEFAGLPQAQQHDRIAKGLAIFAKEGVRADAWVAPSHSFDQATVHALTANGLRVISDGFHDAPATDRHGMVWVPQRLWWFEPRPKGLWTVCLHPNAWGHEELTRFERDLAASAAALASLPEAVALAAQRPFTVTDLIVGRLRVQALKAKQAAARALQGARR